VLIFDEPHADRRRREIRNLLLLTNSPRKAKAIIMISSEMPEVLGMADRILVMHDGRVTGEITDVAHATQEQMMRLAVAGVFSFKCSVSSSRAARGLLT